MNFRIFLVFAVGCLVPAIAAFDFEAFRAAGGQALSWDTRSLVSTAEYPCPNQGFFVHPKNCSRFYRCVDFTNESLIFSRYLFECPEGNVFAQTIEACIPGVCPDGLPSISQVGSGDGSTVGTDSSSGPGIASGSGDTSGSVDASGATDGSSQVEATGVAAGQVTDGTSGEGTEGGSTGGTGSGTGSGMEQGKPTNPSDATMPESGGANTGATDNAATPVSTPMACNSEKPYKQSDEYCNIFYKCGVPDELYACNTGTAFSDDKQMCRLTSFEEELCTGKKVFVVSATAFRDGFRWNDVAVFPSVFPIVANAIPFTFANLRTAVSFENVMSQTDVNFPIIPSPVSSEQVDNSDSLDFGLSLLQETVNKLKKKTEHLGVAGLLGDGQDAGVHAFDTASFTQDIHDDNVFKFLNEQHSNEFADQFQVDPFAQDLSSVSETVLGAVDTETGEVFAAIPVADPSHFPVDLTMRNAFGPVAQFQATPQFGGLVPFMQQYTRNTNNFGQQGFAPNKFAYPSLYGSSQNMQSSYRPFATVVEYIPFSYNPASSPYAPAQAGSPFSVNQPSSPFSFNQASSPFFSKPVSSPYSFNQASSPFFSKPESSPYSFNQASSPFFSKPVSSPYSFNIASSPFFSKPESSPYSFNQASSPFFSKPESSQFSFGQQLPFSQFNYPLAINQISSPHLFRLPTATPQTQFSQASSPFDLNSLLTGGMMASLSNFDAEKAAEDFVNQYFAAAILENKNIDDKKDETDTKQPVESTPGQVTVDAGTLEKLMSGQVFDSSQQNPFGIPSIDSIIERPAIHGVAARNKAGDLFHVIPVNEHELAFLQGIDGLQSRGLDSSLEIVPLTDELLSQMQVGDAIIAGYRKK